MGAAAASAAERGGAVAAGPARSAVRAAAGGAGAGASREHAQDGGIPRLCSADPTGPPHAPEAVFPGRLPQHRQAALSDIGQDAGAAADAGPTRAVDGAHGAARTLVPASDVTIARTSVTASQSRLRFNNAMSKADRSSTTDEERPEMLYPHRVSYPTAEESNRISSGAPALLSDRGGQRVVPGSVPGAVAASHIFGALPRET